MAEKYTDVDPIETQEWRDSISAVIRNQGMDRAQFLLKSLIGKTTESGQQLPVDSLTTPYRNTIPVEEEDRLPGDMFMERNIRGLVRWNALAMVMRAGKLGHDLGGHISTFSSAATLYDVGYNFFFRGETDEQPADIVLFQGHASPGIYSRSFVERRLNEKQLDKFRQEVDGVLGGGPLEQRVLLVHELGALEAGDGAQLQLERWRLLLRRGAEGRGAGLHAQLVEERAGEDPAGAALDGRAERLVEVGGAVEERGGARAQLAALVARAEEEAQVGVAHLEQLERRVRVHPEGGALAEGEGQREPLLEEEGLEGLGQPGAAGRAAAVACAAAQRGLASRFKEL